MCVYASKKHMKNMSELLCVMFNQWKAHIHLKQCASYNSFYNYFRNSFHYFRFKIPFFFAFCHFFCVFLDLFRTQVKNGFISQINFQLCFGVPLKTFTWLNQAVVFVMEFWLKTVEFIGCQQDLLGGLAERQSLNSECSEL